MTRLTTHLVLFSEYIPENVLTWLSAHFSDFGLALSTEFALSEGERQFLARHPGYDHARAALGYTS